IKAWDGLQGNPIAERQRRNQLGRLILAADALLIQARIRNEQPVAAPKLRLVADYRYHACLFSVMLEPPVADVPDCSRSPIRQEFKSCLRSPFLDACLAKIQPVVRQTQGNCAEYGGTKDGWWLRGRPSTEHQTADEESCHHKDAEDAPHGRERAYEEDTRYFKGQPKDQEPVSCPLNSVGAENSSPPCRPGVSIDKENKNRRRERSQAAEDLTLQPELR